MLRALLALLVLVASACATTSATRLGTSQARPPVEDWKSVVVYRTAEQVPGEFEEVAILTGKGSEDWVDEEDVMNSMKKKAASLGANGIILNSSEEGAIQRSTGGLFTEDQLRGQSVAIYVRSSSETQ